MPLDKSGSKESVGKNIADLEKSGRPRAQSIAIALSTARRVNALKVTAPKRRKKN